MNASRRKTIDAAAEKIAEARDLLQSVLDEEQEAFDNMPESLQNGETGERAQSAIDTLDGAISSLQEVEGDLETAKD